MTERISIHANVCHGQACIAGTRVPVYRRVPRNASAVPTDDAVFGGVISVEISNLLAHVIAIIRLRPIAGISRATVAIDSSTWPLKA